MSKALYVASECLFQTVRSVPMLSDEELSRIVKDFYATVIKRENALRLNGGPLPEEARQARIAYFQQVADQARLSLARNQFDDASFVTEAMLRTHKPKRPLDAVERKQVQQVLLRASIDLAQDMKFRYEGDFNYEPRDRLLTTDVSDTITVRPQSEPSVPATKGPLFSEASKKFVSDQLRTKAWERQTANQAEKTFKLFQEINGDLPVDAYTREHAGRFKDTAQQLPADYGKAAQYRGLAINAIIAKHQSAKVQSPLLTPQTTKRHFSALSTLWSALITEGRLQTNIFSGFKFGSSKRPNEQRDMWTEEELQKLFSTPVWRGCKSAWSRSAAGKEIIRDEKFWLPLIAVFSGMRQEEICQLHIEDVRQQGDIWYFDINSKPPRQLKNQSAVRHVPIHDELIRIGFLSYVEQMKRAGKKRVFPNLNPGGADGRLGHGYTKWFTRYRRDTGLYRPKLDFHSFRHSATTFLQRAEVPVPIIDELVGHTGTGETARYTKGLGLAKLHEAINKIRISVDLSSLQLGR